MAKKKEMSIEEKLKDALIEVEEQPYQLPENWEWVRLGSVNTVITGNTPSKNNEIYWETKDISFVKPKDLNQGKNLVESEEYISKEAMKKVRMIPKDSTILCCIGTLGKTAYSKKSICTNQQINSLVPQSKVLNSLYNYYAVTSKFFQEQMWEKSSSTTLPLLNKSRTENLFFPLPPLAEQNRIVEKLDSMLGKIKEAKELIAEARETFQNRRASILDRAFRGELTEKWRAENEGGDATLLLEKINEEKMKKWEEECLEAEKNGKKKPSKPKLSSPEEMLIPEEEQPYQLPENWEWVRLGSVCEVISKGTTPKGGESAYTKEGIKFLRVENINDDNSINSENIKYVDEKTHMNFLKRSILKENDILISIAGTLGRTAIVKKEYLPMNSNQAISFIRLINKKILLPKFLCFLYNNPIIKESLLKKAKITAIPNLTLEIIGNTTIPLPPLVEQEEIVKIVESLLKAEEEVKDLLDMESSIELLEKSILDKAFRGELGTGDSNDEPALEMLKRIMEK